MQWLIVPYRSFLHLLRATALLFGVENCQSTRIWAHATQKTSRTSNRKYSRATTRSWSTRPRICTTHGAYRWRPRWAWAWVQRRRSPMQAWACHRSRRRPGRGARGLRRDEQVQPTGIF
ncbi:hypothetical protein BKA62DRAFT_400303 [Auriculariales sp. MPI-PUGE-AT-0066]|nr:hypothetical protein BKA62DRAFT_400303 [Auriculariales sp. MPI-PUGE-AT-0066]